MAGALAGPDQQNEATQSPIEFDFDNGETAILSLGKKVERLCMSHCLHPRFITEGDRNAAGFAHFGFTRRVRGDE